MCRNADDDDDDDDDDPFWGPWLILSFPAPNRWHVPLSGNTSGKRGKSFYETNPCGGEMCQNTIPIVPQEPSEGLGSGTAFQAVEGDDSGGEEATAEAEEENRNEGERTVTEEAALDEKAKNIPNIPLQENFHRAILEGIRNISDTL